MLAGNLAGMLQRKTLLLRFVMHHAQHNAGDLSLQRRHHGDFGYNRWVGDSGQGYPVLTLGDAGNFWDFDTAEEFLAHLAARYDTVVIHLPAGLNIPQAARWQALTDRNYAILTADSRDYFQLNLLNREARVAADKPHPVRPIIHLEEDECVHGLHQDLTEQLEPVMTGEGSEAPHPATPFLLRDGGRGFSRQLRSLARDIACQRLGLALSSGGAKGLAHVGVIQVLEENGIEVDVVAGTSMGAYVGSLWAHGHDGAELEKLACDLEGRWKPLRLLDPIFPPRRGFIGGFGVRSNLQRTLQHDHFSDTVMPFRAVATNINTLERVVFDRGELIEAVHASIAIPGVCAPVMLGEETYIDGGICDPLPVDVLREMGVERVLAINTIPTPEYLRQGWERERHMRKARRQRRFRPLAWLNKHLNYFAKGNILDNLLLSVHGAQMRIAIDSGRQANLVLRPVSYNGKWHEYGRPMKFIKLGRKVAEEHAAELKALAEVRKKKHENRKAPVTLGVSA